MLVNSSQETIEISNRAIRHAIADVVKSAEVVNLVYVNDGAPGIHRKRHGKTFMYTDAGKRVTDKVVLERIRKLAIPPAWEDVWICRRENGHLQATGKDLKGRKQYRYHALWNSIRNTTKFYRMKDFHLL